VRNFQHAARFALSDRGIDSAEVGARKEQLQMGTNALFRSTTRCRPLTVIALWALAAAIGCELVHAPAALAENPIQVENSLPGDSYWAQYQKAAPPNEIAGYASEVSAAPGGMVQLHVSSTQAYRVEVDRLGWYGGAGGRRVACIPSCTGGEPAHAFPTPAPDPTTGELDAGWPVTDTVQIGANWTTGYYLAMFVLTSGPDAGETAWYPFIVTPPPGASTDVLVQAPVNTWQAYNPWPGPPNRGRSLYGSNSAGGQAAVKVSFNRPLLVNYQSVVFGREYQGIRWLERMGYNVGYYTDVDIDQDPALLLNRTVDMVLGHDEYWTMGMRQGWDLARSTGHSLVFMGADIGTWQTRYEDNWRTLVEYRTAKADPETNPELKTMMFRNLSSPPMPECQLEGVQYDDHLQHPGPRNYTITEAAAGNPWIQAGGLQPGAILANAVAYEWDAIAPGCPAPPLTDLFHYSPAPGESPADAVTFRDPSGAQVFSAGSDQLTGLLDATDVKVPQTTSPALGSFMAAMLNDLIGSAPAAPQASDLVLQRRPLHLRANGCMYVRVGDHGPATISGNLRIFGRLQGRRRRLGQRDFVIASQQSRVVCLHVRRALRPSLSHRRVPVTVAVTFKELQLTVTARVRKTLIVARQLR
jgi:hypothetical protein